MNYIERGMGHHLQLNLHKVGQVTMQLASAWSFAFNSINSSLPLTISFHEKWAVS